MSSYEDEPDESISERILALSEMFPESVRKFAVKVSGSTVSTVKSVYKVSRKVSWFFLSSAAISYWPMLIAMQLALVAELQSRQQKKVLFGAGDAMTATGLPALPIER